MIEGLYEGGAEELSGLVTLEGVDEVLDGLDQVSFDQVHAVLQGRDGWSGDRCELTEGYFKLFLAACELNPDITFAPPAQVDAFWHAYLEVAPSGGDAAAVLKHPPQHNPGLGAPGSGTEGELARAAQASTYFYEQCYRAGLTADPDIAEAVGGFVMCGGGGGHRSNGGRFILAAAAS